jgi:hypothetical protein
MTWRKVALTNGIDQKEGEEKEEVESDDVPLDGIYEYPDDGPNFYPQR